VKNVFLASLQAVTCNWEFYQITTLEVLEKLTRASFNQNAAKTAKQIVGG
jgi:hypothetical protein